MGLGLWNSLPATVVVEGLMFALGLYLYRINTEPVDKVGSGAFVAFVIALVAVYRRACSARRRPDETTICVRRPRAVAAGGLGILARSA